MSDDWQVVEEALYFDRGTFGERRHTKALAALARLREREAQLVADQSALHDVTEAAGVRLERRRAEAAEARVAEIELVFDVYRQDAQARVAELEEALRRAGHELDQWVFADGSASYRVERAEEIIAAALAHKEETP